MLDFDRQQLVNTKEYMNAIASGYKIWIDYSDVWLTFNVSKKIPNSREVITTSTQKIKRLSEFKTELPKHLKQIQEFIKIKKS